MDIFKSEVVMSSLPRGGEGKRLKKKKKREDFYLLMFIQQLTFTFYELAINNQFANLYNAPILIELADY